MTSSKLAQPWSAPLGNGQPVEVVLQQLAGPPEESRGNETPLPGVACLWGAWFGGQAVVTHSPMRWLLPQEDPIEACGELPAMAGGDAHGAGDAHGVQVGGGWIGALPFVPGQGVLGFYDHVIRNDPHLGWVFETLGLPGREHAVRAELVRWRDLLAAAVARASAQSTEAERGKSVSANGSGRLPEDRSVRDEPTRDKPTGDKPTGDKQWSIGCFTSVEPDDRVRDDYLAGVEAVVGKIHRGDYYQLNLCTRLTASFDGDPLALFAEAAAELRPVFGGFITDADRAVISFSPELFLRDRDGRVTTSPIKGTAPRQPGETDSPLLRASAKDAAENIMITDLMRNDLSKVCRPGTVVVEGLLDLQAHPGVWHLVSTVSGQVADDVGVTELLRATFPPGSVTGAPKQAALDGIAALEPVGRGAYTGAFGMISPLAVVELNVLIRTFEVQKDRIELGVGGGITVDSVPMLEWRECLHKAAPLVAALRTSVAPQLRTHSAEPSPEQLAGGVFETLLAIDGCVLRLADHLARLDRSCRELYRTGVPETLAGLVAAQARHGNDDHLRDDLAAGPPAPTRRRAIRVRAEPQASGDLDFTVSSRELGARLRSSDVMTAVRPGRLWRHKWHDRRFLDESEASVTAVRSVSGTVLPLFLATDQTVLETSRGNIFAITGDSLATPPLRDDLLPGVTRRAVLDLAAEIGIDVQITSFDLDHLLASDAVFWTSSLSGVVAVDQVDGPEGGGAERQFTQPAALLNQLNSRLGFEP